MIISTQLTEVEKGKPVVDRVGKIVEKTGNGDAALEEDIQYQWRKSRHIARDFCRRVVQNGLQKFELAMG